MCEKVIRLFNKTMLAGGKDSLLVKFADYGNKKKTQQYRPRESGMWDHQDVSLVWYSYEEMWRGERVLMVGRRR